MNSQSDHHVRRVRCLLERTQKEVDVGRISEFDLVEEVESAARDPGRADEGSLAPGDIGCRSKPVILPFAAGVNDVLANLDREATVVHVGEEVRERRGRTKGRMPENGRRLIGDMYMINRS